MLWLQVEQWKKKEWVSKPLDRTWSWCFPKHWTFHNNSSPTWLSLAFAIRAYVFLRRWFGRSTLLLFSGTFFLYPATFLLDSGCASGWTRIFQDLKRTTFVLLYVCNKDWKLHFWNILEKYNFIQDVTLIDPNIKAGKCKPKIWFDYVGVVLWNQIDEEEKQGFISES